jgi:hypothetical protein
MIFGEAIRLDAVIVVATCVRSRLRSLLPMRFGDHSNRQRHARRSPGASERWSYVLAVAYGLLPGFQVILLKKIIAPELSLCGVRLYETQQSPGWSQAASILVVYSLTLSFSCTGQSGPEDPGGLYDFLAIPVHDGSFSRQS